MEIKEVVTLKEQKCLYCRKKILPKESCFKTNYNSFTCRSCGEDFREILKADKQTKIADFTEQRKLQEYFCEQTKDGNLVDLTDYHYVYDKPVEKFSKLKKVYKHNKDFAKRIEIEREF